MLGPLGDGSALFSPAFPPPRPHDFSHGTYLFPGILPFMHGGWGGCNRRHGGRMELSRRAAPLCSFHGGGKSKSENFLELCHLARGPPEAGRDVRSALWVGQASGS